MAIIIITGGSGLIGTALTQHLLASGHTVRHLSRTAGKKNGVEAFGWDIEKGTLDTSVLDGADHIVHLAGAGIAEKRWTEERVKTLIDSRCRSARLLLEKVRSEKTNIQSFVSAGGINYYGAVTRDKVYVETDPPGTDTIAKISVAWEKAVDEWQPECRVVKLRTPLVLAKHGGALKQIAAPVKWGLGAPFGNGDQWVPWVQLHDLVRAYHHALFTSEMNGAYNVNCGAPTTNAGLMRMTAFVLGKPYFFPKVPAFALKIALGKLSSVLLEGSRASNKKILNTGFNFEHTDLKATLTELLA